MVEMSKARVNWLLFAILACALLLRIVFFSGFQGSDDSSLAYNAMKIMQEGFFLPESHYAARIGLTVPLSVVFRVFGIGEWQIAGFALAFSLLGVWLAYAVGKEVGGSQVGLVAALLLALFPLDVYHATSLYPDTPLGVALALSFFLTLRGLKAERPFWWLLAAGLVWGYGYLIKIEAVFMGAVYLMMMWQYRSTSWIRPFAVIVVFGAVVLAENIGYWLASGDVVHRLAVISGISMKANPDYGQSQLWIFPKAWFVTFYEVGLYYYVLLAALVWALWTRQKALLLTGVWLAVYLFWLEFGGNPFSAHYGIKSHLLRYLGMVSVPMAIISAFFLWRAFKGGVTRTTILVVLVASSLFFINFNRLGQERFYAAKQAVQYAIDHGLFPLYADHTSGAIGAFMVQGTPYEGQVSRIQRHSFKNAETDIMPLTELGGYLLLVRDSMEYTSNRYYMKALDVDDLSTKYEAVYRLDNPMNWLAYRQAELLVMLGDLIPNEFLKEKISGTGKRLLKDKDVVIFRLAKDPS